MNSNSITTLKMANDFIKSMGYQSKKNFHSMSIPQNKGTHNDWGNWKKKIMKKRSKFRLSCLDSKCQKWNQKNWMTFTVSSHSLKDSIQDCVYVCNANTKALECTQNNMPINFETPSISKILQIYFTEMIH